MADESGGRFSTQATLIAALADLGGALDCGPEPGDGFSLAVAEAIERTRGTSATSAKRSPEHHPRGA